jgi:hypothetical protein
MWPGAVAVNTGAKRIRESSGGRGGPLSLFNNTLVAAIGGSGGSGHPDFVARYERIGKGFMEYLASAMKLHARKMA